MQTEKDYNKNAQEYYGKTLNSSEDLKTSACCTMDSYPDHIKAILPLLHDEVITRYYGCGVTIPKSLKGMKILDLGSGSGRDSYLLSRLVGEDGFVTGVDFTVEQLEVASRHIDFHTKQFGHNKKNIEFLKGNIEKLDECGIKDEFYDIIVSNCVINLTKDKRAVLKGAFNALKEGGEIYFSDVYSAKRLPDYIKENSVLHGECIGGAMYWNDFIKTAKESGFEDPRHVSFKEIEISDPVLSEVTKGHKFFSVTCRLFKLKGLDMNCEDYGQAVRYKGTIENSEDSFTLDDHHIFEKGKMELVCNNTFRMLHDTRFKDSFDFFGDTKIHYGPFEGCGNSIPFYSAMTNSNEQSCC